MARGGRRGRLVAAHGKEQTVREWARDLGVHVSTLNDRLASGMPPEKALRPRRQPVDSGAEIMVMAHGKVRSLEHWARLAGIKPSTIQRRLNAGWRPEYAVTKCSVAETREMWPGANRLPYREDRMAQLVVRELAPLTLEQIGAILGVNRERARVMVEQALAKLRATIGPDEREGLLSMLAERDAPSLWSELEDSL